MATIEANVDLARYNTLAIPAVAAYFCQLDSLQGLAQVLDFAEEKQLPVRILGGGSNLILPDFLAALVIRVRLMGCQLIADQGETLLVRVGAGEDWHEFVQWSVAQRLSGIENLALIPGTVGAAPMQNIGAYGVEVASVIESVEAVDIERQQPIELTNGDCQFGYRTSLFKAQENRFLITAVVFRLTRNFQPVLHYPALAELAAQPTITPLALMHYIIKIRAAKLPDPKTLPNAGSFFKNPTVAPEHYQQLLTDYPALVSYQTPAGIRLAAGWLIEHCGFKGAAAASGVGCYRKQALVLVNPQRASRQEVMDWAASIQQAVLDNFGVDLEVEPRQW